MPYRATSGVKPKGGVLSFLLEGLRLEGGKRGHLVFEGQNKGVFITKGGRSIKGKRW